MPVTCPGGGTPRFRVRTLKDGRKQRLAICGKGNVIESVILPKPKSASRSSRKQKAFSGK